MRTHGFAYGTMIAAFVTWAAVAIAGCTVGPNYQRPEIALPAEFGATTRPATETIDIARWWTSFNDPLLNTLIDRAVAGNLDLQIAAQRVVEARAARRIVAADEWPGVNVGGQYQRSRYSENAIPGGAAVSRAGGLSQPGQTTDFFQAGFDATWELDVFGGTRRAVEAAQADVETSVEAQRDVLVSLLAEVARNYLELRGYQQQIVIARENLTVQQDAVKIAQSREGLAGWSELDVTRAKALVAQTEATIPALEQLRDAAAHRLGVLLGQPPRSLIAELAGVKAIAKGPPEVPPGLPSELLRRRPDVRQAERSMAGATARVGVATADLFPRFSLTAALGLQSQGFDHIADWRSRFWSIAPGVSWPIFDAGRIRANIEMQNAREQQAALRYRQAVLEALADVENALTAYQKEQARRQLLAQAVENDRRSVQLAKTLYQGGTRDFLNVIDAERALFISEDALVRCDRTISTNLVALYKALGGGWNEAPAPATAPVAK